MKVIEIIKRYRNGEIKHHMVIEHEDEESINDLVEEWCEREGSGHNYGWSSTWKFVEDAEVKKKVISEDISRIDGAIKVYNKLKFKLEQELLDLNYTYRK